MSQQELYARVAELERRFAALETRLNFLEHPDRAMSLGVEVERTYPDITPNPNPSIVEPPAGKSSVQPLKKKK